MLKHTETRTQLKKPLCALVLLSVLAFLYIYASVYNNSSRLRSSTSKAPGSESANNYNNNNNNIGGEDVIKLVNVFIGTTGSGHVFPGATLPHGMVKVGMDTDSPDKVSCEAISLIFEVHTNQSLSLILYVIGVMMMNVLAIWPTYRLIACWIRC